MSVDYKSALIYGYELNPCHWTPEEIEVLEEFGWETIRDFYNDSFLYAGKIISSTECYEKANVDCLRELASAESDVNDLIDETPDELFKKFPCDASMYHICYAT